MAWTSNEQAMTKSWSSHEQCMNKSWTSHKQVLNKSWTSTLLKLLKFLKFLTIPGGCMVYGVWCMVGVWWITTAVIIRPSQPSLAGVGAGAELGNKDPNW